MDLHFDETLAAKYKSSSQKVRVMSEDWVAKNMFCPICGNLHLQSMKNNQPVADFQCNNCSEIFELKSKKGTIGKRISDGAYRTMIDQITNIRNPNLFVMQYTSGWQITNFIMIPKFFFTPSIIEKRKPLDPTARRAGWEGCNILLSNIPCQARIKIIENQILHSADEVVRAYHHMEQLQLEQMENRGWLLDVLNCINQISSEDFYLSDLYVFVEFLQSRHPTNHNVKAKIRQQLQLLRNKGWLIFLERGHYKKNFNQHYF